MVVKCFLCFSLPYPEKVPAQFSPFNRESQSKTFVLVLCSKVAALCGLSMELFGVCTCQVRIDRDLCSSPSAHHSQESRTPNSENHFRAVGLLRGSLILCFRVVFRVLKELSLPYLGLAANSSFVAMLPVFQLCQGGVSLLQHLVGFLL